jgi:hypothetical protein
LDEYNISSIQVENQSSLNSRNILSDYTFSGTDNGIVKMTQSIPVTSQKYKYHLKLHNSYSLLEEEDPKNEFEPLPTPYAINSGDIDLGGGHYKYRNWLQRQKHKHHAIFDLEKDPLQNKQQLRDFYFSKKMLIKKKKDLTDKRFRDRLLSKERRILKGKEKKKLMMFIGDRGTGVGSKIKGNRRY